MTGMLMLGKISTGVRSRTTGLIRRSTTDNTMNVYGRARASLTIHMTSPRLFRIREAVRERLEKRHDLIFLRLGEIKVSKLAFVHRAGEFWRGPASRFLTGVVRLAPR